jgi:uncharacterized protein (AIM24 family)
LVNLSSCIEIGPGPIRRDLNIYVVGTGSVSPAGGKYTIGTKLDLQATPAAGWRFDHWEGGLTGSENPVTVELLDDLTVSAVFVEIPVNSTPACQNLTVTMTVNQHAVFDLVGTDSDGGQLTYSISTQPKHGGLLPNFPAVTYVPNRDYIGTDRLTYKASDGELESAAATVNFVIAPAGVTGWARSLGGVGIDQVNALVVDSTGVVYAAGHFSASVDFDPGPANAIRTSAGGTDAFVAQFSSDGDLVWIKTFGGAGNDTALGLAPDGSGGVYVAGGFSGKVNFETDGSADVRTSAGESDAFVCRFSGQGERLWTHTYGGSGDDRIYGVAAGVQGNVYLAGSFETSTNFDHGNPAGTATQSLGRLDGFLLKLNVDGTYLWVKTFGGSADDEILGVCTRGYERVSIAGYFSDIVDLAPGPMVHRVSSNGMDDIFAVTLTSNGDYVSSYSTGGIYSDRGLAIDCDESGNIYLSGWFSDTVDFDPGSSLDEHHAVGQADAFVVSYRDAGVYQWARTFGGAGSDQASSVLMDSDGNAYVAGSFSQQMDLGGEVRTSNGGTDIFFAKYAQDGSVVWADTFGGTGNDRAWAAGGIRLKNKEVYGGGCFQADVDLNPDPTSVQVHHAFGEPDICIFKLVNDTGAW